MMMEMEVVTGCAMTAFQQDTRLGYTHSCFLTYYAHTSLVRIHHFFLSYLHLL